MNKSYNYNLIYSEIGKYKTFEAIDFIDSVSKKSRVIFINEAHHIPEHRNFILQLIPVLYENNYRTIGMEAFFSMDTNIYERGYPIRTTGFYIKDPIYANIIRKGLELKLDFFGYDVGNIGNAKNREINQAKYILEELKKDSNSKFLIIAGFDHIREDTNFKSWGKAMAGRFFEYSGINPITIDQVEFTTKFNDSDNNPLYESINSNEPIIPVGLDKKFVNPYSNKGFDYYIFHPKPKNINNVPIWKYNEDYTPLFMNFCMLNYEEEYVILAYSYEEYKKENFTTDLLIPLDIVTYKNFEHKPLLLPPSKYFIEVINNNKLIVLTTIVENGK